MSSHTNIVQEKALQLMQSIGQNTYLKSIMSGMMLILPVTIMSSVATLVKVFPFAPISGFFVTTQLNSLL
ncbi:cellobiose-specific PTS family enzyme IIC component [Klebsiella pneumoniae subsp. ozaenae]|uniref:Cellobiose-specific PTS family enzyme IIC component n=1 Tax=Klebsiella pneumoniae subsp. ozaenae TaxID=574 RepID=A0A378B248_KLEPO|nr:cellobiose-specific PTS family enzyme IIC component [Klebsiella pneumoniae subsp. ozaenae]